ncbi:hypothetical protein JB92DRAFT_2994129 [Gautieria morchelliformis]|nr:hypothetical protein JB92DRAFT_2994129 [Gautieria morchelliformis]
MGGNIGSGDIIHGTASADARVKTEATPSFTSDPGATGKGVLHVSSQAPATYFQSAVSFCVDTEGTDTPSIHSTNTGSSPSHHFHNEFSHNILNLYPISNSIPFTYEPATAARNQYTADAGGVGFSPPPRPHFSNRVLPSNNGFQTAASASASLTDIFQSFDKRRDPCNCLKDPMAFAPLVHLGIALRTSREVLERLHPPSSDCVLYCRIYVLEQHIFSVPPHEQHIKFHPLHLPARAAVPPSSHVATFPS